MSKRQDDTIDGLAAIVLAAGKGSRMGGSKPKVLHELAGKPMLVHVLERLAAVPVEHVCLILQDDLAPFQNILASHSHVTVCSQTERNGTGGAVAVAARAFEGVEAAGFAHGNFVSGPRLQQEYCLIIAGDTPNLAPDVLRQFVTTSMEQRFDIAVCGMEPPDPTGYGRLVVDECGQLSAIIEEKDASAEEKMIPLCNSGVFWAKTRILFELLTEVDSDNSQKEFYLTDCIAVAKRKGLSVGSFRTAKWESFVGINTQEQLHQLTERMASLSNISVSP